MTTSQDSSSGQNVYFNDPESGAEMTRLLDHDRLMTKEMGGLFPAWFGVDPSSIQRVVDLACGPGGWAQEMAFAYPDKEVFGVDISQSMIAYANMQAQVQGLHNAHFSVMDILQPLKFPDNSFDLINTRLIGFLPPASWPPFIQECVRIAQPGGVIRLCECEWLTNSPGCEKLSEMFVRGLHKFGQSFSPDGRMLGMVPMLAGFLEDGGCQNVRQAAQVIDLSAGREANYAEYRNWQVFYKELEPFFLKAGVTTQEEFDQAYEQMQREILMDNFRGLIIFVSAWGQKP
jgi:ubiquinone/menaquinone biosynthesis C-methylase UbiE